MAAENSTRPAAESQRSEGSGESERLAAANKDLAAAVVIGLFSALAVLLSIRLELRGSVYTAPGLVPLIAGSTLFVMAVVLGSRAIRAGAAIGPLAVLAKRLRNVLRAFTFAEETRRTVMLAAMLTAYVVLVGLIDFEFSLPLQIFTVRVSSYEVISVVMVGWILRLFWQASVARCFLTALIAVEVLAAIFRYGFGIPMPAAY